ncbi:MAG TPA: hypothetical protein VLH16_01785 [Bacteroidales bacterium]|nr:hypothetical protein [Bacteroidales bacterium]
MAPVLLIKSDLDYRAPEQESEFALNFLKKGLGYYHVFKKNWSEAHYKTFFNEIPEYLHNRLIINRKEHNGQIQKHVGVYIENGIHSSMIPSWEIIPAITVRRNCLRVTSVGKLRQLSSALFFFDAVYLTSVFNGGNLEIQNSSEHQRLKNLLTYTRKMVFASGCVNASNIHSLVHFGFPGIVLNRCIWDAKNPMHEFEMLYNYVRRLTSVTSVRMSVVNY